MIVLPSAWVMAEAIRSWQSLGGPWALLGASEWNQPATLASASLGGVWLTTFLLVAANTAIAGVMLHRGVSGRVIALTVALVCAGLGPAWFVLGSEPPVGSTVRVALVQPGDIADSATRQAAAEALTETLTGQRPDLVVWGESSVGVDLTSHPDALTGPRGAVPAGRRGPARQRRRARPDRGNRQVVRSHRTERNTRRHTRKSGWCRSANTYPCDRYWAGSPGTPTPQPRTGGAGSGLVVLHAGSLGIGPLISYEATFSDLPRHEAQLGAQLLAYQSSTSTYQGSWAQPQLASQVAVHAVEVGRAAVHAGLSGDSSAFDARGRKLAWCPSGFRGAIVVSVPLGSGTTVYQRLGDWVLALAFSILLGAVVLAILPSRRGHDV